MNPSMPVILRTLKASLEEHVIPELESNFARGQAGQVAVTLEWLAQGWEEPLQKLREGNSAIREALERAEGELGRLAEQDAAQRDHWLSAQRELRAALAIPREDTVPSQEDARKQAFKVLDDLVIAAGVPTGGDQGTGPLWKVLQQGLEALARAETYMGPIPLPPQHWR